MAAGTGGTVAGLSNYLKERNPALRVFIIDPAGSSLASMVESHNTNLAATPGSTIIEGIGTNRLTANFAAARVDAAFRGSDQEAINMAYYLLRYVGRPRAHVRTAPCALTAHPPHTTTTTHRAQA